VDGARMAVGVADGAAAGYAAVRDGKVAMPPVRLAVGGLHSAVVDRRAPGLPAPSQGRAAPPMPSSATARTPTTVQQQQTNNITIHQQPGESSEALARRTANALQHQQAVQARATLGDRN